MTCQNEMLWRNWNSMKNEMQWKIEIQWKLKCNQNWKMQNAIVRSITIECLKWNAQNEKRKAKKIYKNAYLAVAQGSFLRHG